MITENQFCSLSVCDLLRLTPCVFWCEIFTRRSSLCLLSFAEIWASDSSHKTGIKLFIFTARAERKVRLCVKLFVFFSWVNTHMFDLKFVAFCPKFIGDSYVELRKKLFRENFS